VRQHLLRVRISHKAVAQAWLAFTLAVACVVGAMVYWLLYTPVPITATLRAWAIRMLQWPQ